MIPRDIQRLIEENIGDNGAILFNSLLSQEPRPADAIVFLQGDKLDRAQKVKDLFDQGYAPRILITGNNVRVGLREENDANIQSIHRYFLEQGVPRTALLLDDTSLNTLEQAKHTVALVKKEDWKMLLVVTSPFHLLRTYLTFLKQKDAQQWNGTVITQAPDFSWDGIPSGRRKTAKEMLQIELQKIDTYKSNLATVQEGVRTATS